MRFFIALEIPDDSREQISQVQDGLKQLAPQAKLTNPDKLHLTIAFIGDQPDSLKEHLIRIMTKAAQNIKPFTVTPAFIDGFPHLHTATTLWIGVKGDIDGLYRLRHHIKDGLENLELPVDHRRFIPHIAIAKLNNFELSPQVEAGFEKLMSKPFTPITVSAVKLFESIPDEGLHKHNTLAEINLVEG